MSKKWKARILLAFENRCSPSTWTGECMSLNEYFTALFLWEFFFRPKHIQKARLILLERVLRFWQGQTRRKVVAIKFWSVEVVIVNVEMWRHSANNKWMKKLSNNEENSGRKLDQIYFHLSLALSSGCFSSKLCAESWTLKSCLSRKLRVLVGLYKRLSESGVLKKVIAWISPTRTRLFWGIKVL